MVQGFDSSRTTFLDAPAGGPNVPNPHPNVPRMYHRWVLSCGSIEQSATRIAHLIGHQCPRRKGAIYIPHFPSTDWGISWGVLRGGRRAQLAPGHRRGQSFFHRVGHELGETLRLE